MTGPPVVIVFTIFDFDSSFVVECSAMIDRPPFDRFAPRTKSICPPIPEICLSPIASAQTCPCRSTSTQELIETTLLFWEITAGLLHTSTGSISNIGLLST